MNNGSRLFEEERERISHEKYMRINRCVALTNKLKSFIDEQKNVNGSLSEGFRLYDEVFPTECDQFESFMSSVNNDSSHPYVITRSGDNVDRIRTEINIDRKRIHYALYRSSGGGDLLG